MTLEWLVQKWTDPSGFSAADYRKIPRAGQYTAMPLALFHGEEIVGISGWRLHENVREEPTRYIYSSAPAEMQAVAAAHGLPIISKPTRGWELVDSAKDPEATARALAAGADPNLEVVDLLFGLSRGHPYAPSPFNEGHGLLLAMLVGALVPPSPSPALVEATDFATPKTTPWGTLPLVEAALAYSLDRHKEEGFLWLVKNGLASADLRDRYGRNLLHSTTNEPQAYRALVELGADPDARAELPRAEVALLRLRGHTPPYWHGKTPRELSGSWDA